MASHRIHLRGPWDYEWIQSATEGIAPAVAKGTVSMPRHWQAIFGVVSGTASFHRKFHRPTNLDPHESVFVLFTEVRGAGTVHLNDQQIGSFASDGTSVEFDVTKALEPFNHLQVEMTFLVNEGESVAGGLFGVAALEIRSD